MNRTLQFSWLGIILALAFSGSMGSLFWWMLHVPPPLGRQIAKVRESVKAWRRILVPTVGQVYSDRAIEMACRLGSQQKAAIFLAYIVEIPRTLALEARLEEGDKRAAEILGQAAEIVKLSGLEVETVVRRARQAGDEICDLADRLDIDLIVMGIRKRIGAADMIFGRTSDIVLRRAPCEVLIDRMP